MSDRLSELQRQRALAQEQLLWLDREIARETALGHPKAPAPHPVGINQPATPITGADPEELIKQFQDSGRSVQTEVKRGCFIYFFAAFAVLALGIATFYLIWRR